MNNSELIKHFKVEADKAERQLASPRTPLYMRRYLAALRDMCNRRILELYSI